MKLFQPLDVQQITSRFNRYFQKLQQKHPSRPLQVRVYSQKLGLDYSFPLDSTNQPYHIASIGKVFTAVIVYRLAERGLLHITDRINQYLPTAMLRQLFVYQGSDYSSEVTIEQLLGHTSGINDYFEGKIISDRAFIEDILANPQTHWTPKSLLDFTREHQTALGVPGTVFFYSDTGYILLGLLIEAVTGKPFDQNLEDEIFRPLEMCDSYLMFYGKPANSPQKPIEKIWFNGQEISEYESLTCDWSGGGIITTTTDLLKFSQALRSGQLLPPNRLMAMAECRYRFRQGIYYGLGMMEIRFKEFFFLLNGLPKVKGHIGILATHMFYDEVHDAHVILNFGDNTRIVESFQALIEIENVLQRAK